jgi:hypothetical protein
MEPSVPPAVESRERHERVVSSLTSAFRFESKAIDAQVRQEIQQLPEAEAAQLDTFWRDHADEIRQWAATPRARPDLDMLHRETKRTPELVQTLAFALERLDKGLLEPASLFTNHAALASVLSKAARGEREDAEAQAQTWTMGRLVKHVLSLPVRPLLLLKLVFTSDPVY